MDQTHYYKCPECGGKITNLNYDSNINEWGYYDIWTEDWDTRNTETNETTYRCPQCENEIYNLDEIEEWTDDEEKNQIEKKENTEKFEVEEDSSVKVKYNEIIKMSTLQEYRYLGEPIIEQKDTIIEQSTICPKCKKYFITQESTVECPNCYTEINVKKEREKAYSSKEKKIIKIIKNKLHGKRF